jgi:hypothetical protein
MKSSSIARVARLAIALVLGFVVSAAFSSAAMAGTVTGVVRNGTTNTVVAGAQVLLISLQGGMQVVANTKTDSAGKYHFQDDAIGQGPMLIRAVYKGVNFHQPLPPGTPTADITVYEPTTNPMARAVAQRLVVLQPNGTSLLVGEEFSIENKVTPPAAYYDEKGDFEFQIPEGAQLSQVSAWGPSGMPVVQGTIDKGPDHYAIAFAFQPGDNGVRISYEIPYGSNSASLVLTSPYDSGHMLVAAPPTVQVSSDGFQAGGTEQGYNVYTHDLVAAGAKVQIAVSGTAPPPAADNAAGSGGDQGAPDQSNGRDSGDAASGSLQVIPPRLDSLRWILVGGFAALFALGLVYLWRRPVLAPQTAGGGVAMPAANPSARAASAPNYSSPATATPLAPAAPIAAAAPGAHESVEQAQRDVVQSLDGMKDTLFRLELRRQAGTISEEEYVRERARMEKILRDLLHG